MGDLEEPGEPGIAETHISVLFFVGDRVYKLKKPVRFDFVDLTTREQRRRICHREVELNRRLSPDVYLGVLDVVDADGRPVDHLVEMRRMPPDRRLATLVERGADVDACLRRVAHDIATFHAAAPASPEISQAGAWSTVRAKWTSDIEEMGRFTSEVVDNAQLARVRADALRYVDGRRALFESRIEQGYIRDGHGDLLADDIFCLEDGPRVLDCIEFNDDFRYGDVLTDVAFLAMDLERLGAAGAAARFLAWYSEFSGEAHPSSLAQHYIAYRALIRSKVACLRHEQDDGGGADAARHLLSMSEDHLKRGRVRLVLVGGLPGTGKSMLSMSMSDVTGWAVLRSDEVRKELAGLSSAATAAEGFEHGIYTPQMNDKTYKALLDRARRLLELGESTILDASWIREEDRKAAHRVAAETSSDLVELRCVLPAAEAADRLAQRDSATAHGSDADERIAQAMAQRFDPWPQAAELSTRSSPGVVLRDALSLAGPFPQPPDGG